MAKFTRDDDDERDEPSRPDRSGGGAVALVLLAAGGVFALLVVVGLAAMSLFTARAEVREVQMMAEEAELARRDAELAAAATREAAADTAVRPREEWARLLVGKTRDEVTEIAGRPDRTSDAPSWTWSYDRRSLDPAGESTDPAMTVWFRGADGPAERVSFGPVTP